MGDPLGANVPVPIKPIKEDDLESFFNFISADGSFKVFYHLDYVHYSAGGAAAKKLYDVVTGRIFDPEKSIGIGFRTDRDGHDECFKGIKFEIGPYILRNPDSENRYEEIDPTRVKILEEVKRRIGSYVPVRG